jgi:hypothetical protein
MRLASAGLSVALVGRLVGWLVGRLVRGGHQEVGLLVCVSSRTCARVAQQLNHLPHILQVRCIAVVWRDAVCVG